LRRHALAKTNGEASVKANWTGKVNTALRQGTIAFASSPLGERFPGVRTGLQIASTATTLASGAATAYSLLRQVRKYKEGGEKS
jgi:hypothetical protein